MPETLAMEAELARIRQKIDGQRALTARPVR
jgi:hypothetical protein